MPSSSGQASDSVLRAYRQYMGPRNTLAPFQDRSTPEEIVETLQSFHNNAPKNIEEILRRRKKWLQKIIRFLDIEVGFHSFTREAVDLLRNDFSKHIYFVVYKIPYYEHYIEQWRTVVDSFAYADSELDAAIRLGSKPSDIRRIRSYKSHFYEHLHQAIRHLEQGYKNFRIVKQISEPVSSTNQPGGLRALDTRLQKEKVKKVEETLELLRQRVDVCKKTLDSIHDELAFRNVSMPTINTSEYKLRREVLASLIEIPEQILLEESVLEGLLQRSGIRTYIYPRGDVIEHVRRAKLALNRALDEYDFIAQVRIGSDELLKHRKSCIISLRDALARL